MIGTAEIPWTRESWGSQDLYSLNPSHIDDDIALLGIKTDIITGETNFLADFSGNLLEVNLALVDTNFSKKNNLNSRKY